MESTKSNRFYTVWNGNFFKRVTFIECSIFDTRDALVYYYLFYALWNNIIGATIIEQSTVIILVVAGVVIIIDRHDTN